MRATTTIFTDFMKDVERHLDSKFEGIPKHHLQEISAYIANRAQVLLGDMLYERDKDWKKSLDRCGVKATIAYERPEEEDECSL